MNMATVELVLCEPGQTSAEAFVTRFLPSLIGDLGHVDSSPSSPSFRGGQSYADKALAALDLHNYRRDRNYVHPERRRAASRLSPYIRHGLLTLPRVWQDVIGPSEQVKRFRLELLWQEYARHWYARLGRSSRQPLRSLPLPPSPREQRPSDGWDQSMGCVEMLTDELSEEGWLVGQSRLWLASQWAVRQGLDWRRGEDHFFAHLLDGSRAANRLGWQAAVGLSSGRPYNFSRWQVEARSPGLCATCERNSDCPIDRWPNRAAPIPVDQPNPLLFNDPDPSRTAGPEVIDYRPDRWADGRQALDLDAVWLTAESMGDDDPALRENPDLPVMFVFDRPLLQKLQLSCKRLVFMVETLAELATKRELHVFLGSPAEALGQYRVATTFAPVPGWRRHAAAVDPVAVHPWPWLYRPSDGDISGFPRWFEHICGVPVDDQATETVLAAIPMKAKMSYVGS